MTPPESASAHKDSATLHRSLGLYAVLTISIGAMIGSGIFVLPGLAFKITGPSVVAAFFLAGIVVLPAALSKAEMATAMPQAGGTYLYIDRAMGPLMGTVAGFGVWFSLVFKASFALVGLSAYLEYFIPHPERPVAALLAVVLIGVNLLGVRQTAKFQMLLVSGVILVLLAFVGIGAPHIQSSSFDPFMAHGIKGVLSATAVVFVSYAGVTKVASIAEEVRRPGRNIPMGMLVSIGFMMLLYPAIVAVIVGVSPGRRAGEDRNSDDPRCRAVRRIGRCCDHRGRRRDRAPVHDERRHHRLVPLPVCDGPELACARGSLPRSARRSGGPIAGIAVTGVVLLALVMFVPLLELAKLASAFQLLVFALINLALIAFREAHLDWYEPQFRSPLYPATQIFGIAAALLLLTQMGTSR